MTPRDPLQFFVVAPVSTPNNNATRVVRLNIKINDTIPDGLVEVSAGTGHFSVGADRCVLGGKTESSEVIGADRIAKMSLDTFYKMF